MKRRDFDALVAHLTPVAREEFWIALETSGIPLYMRKPIEEYVFDGCPVGDFLTAVLSDKLQESFGRADEDNRAAMYNWCRLIYNHVPIRLWGSLERVEDWIRCKGLERSGNLDVLD